MAFVFGVVAAFEGAVPFVFELEVEARDGLAFDQDIFGAQVALFVEVARGPDEDYMLGEIRFMLTYIIFDLYCFLSLILKIPA